MNEKQTGMTEKQTGMTKSRLERPNEQTTEKQTDQPKSSHD